MRLLLLVTCLAAFPAAAIARDAVDQPRVAYDYDFGGRGAQLSGDQGRWSGSWEGRYADGADGRYEGVFRGTYLPPAPVTAAAPVTMAPVVMAAAVPVTVPVSATMPAPVAQPQAYAYPYGYAAPIIIRVEPAVRKTTTVVEEIVEPE